MQFQAYIMIFFSQKKEGEYVSGLKWRLQFAYKVAGREAIRQGKILIIKSLIN